MSLRWTGRSGATVIFVVIAASATVVAGCGGDGESDEKQAFIDQADDRCQATQDQLTNLVVDPADPIDSFDETIPIINGLAASLRALTPPPGDEQEVAELIGVFDTLTSLLQQAVDARAAGDEATAQQILLELETGGDAESQRFRDYGFDVCAQTGSG